MAKLLLKHEGVTIQSYPLDKEIVSIGRKAVNEIHIDDTAVSSVHARLRVMPSAYLDELKDVFIEDMGSTNGTKVNGNRVERQLLKHGDVIQIGKYQFTFHADDSGELEQTAIYLPEDEA